MDVAECPHVQAASGEDPTDISKDNERFPWTGRPFGLKDVRFLSAVAPPHVVGVVGPANAGKTTLLGMLFLMFYRGIDVLEDTTFAGSFTFQGWENVARYLQLSADGPIRFPPHTSQAGRFPGLLHLRLQDDAEQPRDCLISDAPGEWFTNWTDDADAENASGARWIAANSDKIVIVADTEALTGAQHGPARTGLEFLVRRVQSCVSRDAVGLLWTKSDITRPPDLIDTVNRHFLTCFPDAPIFSIHVPGETDDTKEVTIESMRNLFQWLLTARNERIELRWPVSECVDPFLFYRGV